MQTLENPDYDTSTQADYRVEVSYQMMNRTLVLGKKLLHLFKGKGLGLANYWLRTRNTLASSSNPPSNKIIRVINVPVEHQLHYVIFLILELQPLKKRKMFLG